jgi:hypothetical protein
MRAMASSNRVIEDKEQVAPKVVQTQRESTFKDPMGRSNLPSLSRGS